MISHLSTPCTNPQLRHALRCLQPAALGSISSAHYGMARDMVARHLLWKWIPAPYCLRGKLSIFSYFVASFHLLELLDTSGRYLLLWLLHKSILMSSSPSQSMGFIQLTHRS